MNEPCGGLRSGGVRVVLAVVAGANRAVVVVVAAAGVELTSSFVSAILLLVRVRIQGTVRGSHPGK